MLERLDNSFLEWFLEDYVSKNPEKWAEHTSTIRGLHGDLEENTKETAKALDCLHFGQWPKQYLPISAEYSNSNGGIKIWEEKKPARVFEGAPERIVLAPYLEYSVLPPKKALKQSIKTGVSNISDSYVQARIASDPEIQKALEGLGNQQITQLVSYRDGKEVFAKILVKTTRDGIAVEPFPQATEADIKIGIGIEFLYDLLKLKKKPKTIPPSWEGEQEQGFVEGALEAMEVVPIVFKALLNGSITVEPITALPATMASATQMAEMISRMGN